MGGLCAPGRRLLVATGGVTQGLGGALGHLTFEEQIEHPTPDADLPDFFDNPAGPGAPRRYLDLIEECVESVDVPVIASINGTSRHGWTSFAHHMQDAGAAAVECNFYNVPQRMQGPVATSRRDVWRWCMRSNRKSDVPVAVKLTPFYSSFGELALRLVETGADGPVLFNRFLQPQIDVQTLTVAPVIGLSHSSDARLASLPHSMNVLNSATRSATTVPSDGATLARNPLSHGCSPLPACNRERASAAAGTAATALD